MSESVEVAAGESGSASEVAYQRLAHLIETCQLPPGWHLGNETEESAKLGMSRTPFREALARLEQEGLISRVAKHRTYVTKIDPVAFDRQMTLRRGIELELLRDALGRGVEFDLPRLARILRSQAAAARRGDTDAFLRLDPELHRVIMESCDNPVALTILDTAWRHLNRIRYLAVHGPGYLAGTLGEHQLIVEALRDRDVRKLERAVRTHTQHAMRDRLQQVYDSHPHAFLAPPTV